MQTIKINGLIFTILFNSKVEIDGVDVLGKTDFITMQIYIRKNTPIEHQRKILMHELTHAYIYSYGFDYVELNTETMCEFVANYSDAIIRDTNKIMEEKQDANRT